MDKQAKIELLEANSFAFDVALTLDETEWTRILGPEGLGNKLLHEMVSMAQDLVDLTGADHLVNTTGELFCFTLDGVEHQFRLDYEQPFTANLQTAVKQVLDGVNGAIRRQTTPFRFVCVRDTCTGAGCTYRLMLLPTSWLRELEDEINIVAGVSLEDYEVRPPHGVPQVPRPEIGDGPMAAR